MRHLYEAAGGSVAGRSHVLAGRANQDAYAWTEEGPALCAAVCDGCSAAAGSGAGALLGARLVAGAVAARMARGGDPSAPRFWEEANAEILGRLRTVAETVGGREWLLFTVVGAAVGPARACLFAAGDGLVAWNGGVTVLGPYPGNEPPYLAYALEGGPVRLEILRSGPVEELESLLVGSDGVSDLACAADRAMPGGSGPVGPLEQFWREDRYFRNPDALRRRLALANREIVRLDRASGTLVREGGLLPDDTTLVVVRRRRP